MAKERNGAVTQHLDKLRQHHTGESLMSEFKAPEPVEDDKKDLSRDDKPKSKKRVNF